MSLKSTLLGGAAAALMAIGPALAQAPSTTTPPMPGPGTAQAPATQQGRIPDGAPGNPPSTATGRAMDRATGQPTSPDGTGNNPPGTAVGRALTPGAPGTTGAAASGTQGVGANQAGLAAGGEIRPNARASKIIGANIYNEQGQSIGEVEDLVLSSSGAAPVAVISVGGFLGIGSRLVAVPLSDLQYGTQTEHWTLRGATRETLQARPAVTYGSRN